MKVKDVLVIKIALFLALSFGICCAYVVLLPMRAIESGIDYLERH